MLSLNARGIRSFEKRKALFRWLSKNKSDIIFLQETYSTPEIENLWKTQWKGDLFFAHGSEHSRGVLILVRENLNYELKLSSLDTEEGRFIILKVIVQEQPFLLVNIYAPNKASEQCTFFQKLHDELDSLNVETDCDIIIGGDFNVILDPDLDGLGGKPKLKESVKILDQIRSSLDLIDIWRVRNPDIKRFSWRQKNPVIQRRLDFWLISSSIQEDLENVDIIPAIKSDHSAITLSINGIEDQCHGPSFWKFNSSLIDDEIYLATIREKYVIWIAEGREISDPRILWDYIKYKIRQETIAYSKRKARERREKLSNLEMKLRACQLACDNDPSTTNLNDLEILQTEYDRRYEFIAQGAIIRSRANWYEYGEKSNKYFLNLENSRKKKTCVRKLNLEDEKSTSNPKEILKEIQSFYANLYDNKVNKSDENLIDSFLSKVNTNTLTNEQRDKLETQLNLSECFATLKTFQKNKTPGNDGLTVEFYLAFWPLVGKALVDCLNYSHQHGELSTSQKQAMITLLEKKDKDRRSLKNWRPISLINVDVKIASKAMAKRLEPILPHLIHHSQNAFVKGRSVFDAIRTIEDTLEFAKRNNRSGILVAIDFEKAFDSLNRNFLLKVLQKFNFGMYFTQWIRTFYTNLTSCVLNNGFTTDLFCVNRGVRQGDPLSPLLFILSLEILTCYIRQDNNIKGLKVNNEELKLTLFADDLTCFLKDRQSYNNLFVTLKLFSRFSGLCVNDEKTELFAIGTHKLVREEFDHNICTSIQILGIYFDYHKQTRKNLNFSSILKSIKKTLNMWRWRGLTLLGRIQIVKTFAIPKFMYKASLISVSEDLIRDVNKLLYGFIWKGNDKIKRSALINDIENGGLKMLDLHSMIMSQRIITLKRYFEEYCSPWKNILNIFLGEVGGKFILYCNFDTRKLPIYLPDFYKECLDAWSELNQIKVVSYEDVVNQIIWNNKYILSGSKSSFIRYLVDQGIAKIGDLISDTGRFLESEKLLRAKLSPINYFNLMGIVNAIPKEWRLIIRHNQQHTHPPLNHVIKIKIDGAFVDLLKISSKMVYNEFKRMKQTVPSAQAKTNSRYPEFSLEWKKIYSLSFSVTLDTKVREFQYKILNNIIFTNEKLFRFKMINSPLCVFCQTEVESMEHLFFYCNITKLFWKSLMTWIIEKKISITQLTLENVLFGVFNIKEDFQILNHLILVAKFYIYKCKLHNVHPSLNVFLVKVKATCQIEQKIATDNNKLGKHYKKWNKLLSYLN